MRILGILLIVAGSFALAYGGIKYKKNEKIFDLGFIQTTVEQEKTLPLPPWVGGAGIGAGALLILLAGGGSRRR